MMRRQPFWVNGQLAQPCAMCVRSHAERLLRAACQRPGGKQHVVGNVEGGRMRLSLMIDA
jgi:hypothetical protein